MQLTCHKYETKKRKKMEKKIEGMYRKGNEVGPFFSLETAQMRI